VGPAAISSAPPNTPSRYEDVVLQPLLSDWRNFETWREAGALDARAAPNAIWRELLKKLRAAAARSAIREELEAYVARRKQEIVASKYAADRVTRN